MRVMTYDLDDYTWLGFRILGSLELVAFLKI